MNKLIELMKNVVNQNGFEYEGKRIKNKAAAEGKSTSEGHTTTTTTAGWLGDIMMAKLRADESLEDFLSRQRAAEKADLDAIGQTDREKNDGKKASEGKMASEIDARDSTTATISKAEKMSAHFEDVIRIKKDARRGQVCFTAVISDGEPAGIGEDFSTTGEATSSVASEGDGEAVDRGGESRKKLIEEGSHAVNEETSEEEVNTEGCSDSQRENVEDLHAEGRAGEEVTGDVPSEEELTIVDHSDTQKEDSFIVCSRREPRTSAGQRSSREMAEAPNDSDEGAHDDTDTPSYACLNRDHVDVGEAHVDTLSESRDETIVEEVQPPGQ